MLLAAANLHHHSLHVLVVATTTARAVAFKDYVRAAAMAKHCCCYLLSSCLAAAALHAVVVAAPVFLRRALVILMKVGGDARGAWPFVVLLLSVPATLESAPVTSLHKKTVSVRREPDSGGRVGPRTVGEIFTLPYFAQRAAILTTWRAVF